MRRSAAGAAGALAALLAALPLCAGFKVICVGYPRTGLTSLEEALLKVGFSPYRMGHRDDLDKSGHTKDVDRWLEVLSTEDLAPLEKLADDILQRGYNAILDVPLDNTAIALGLVRHFPKAKVILTLHDGAEGWFNSYRVHMQDFNLGTARFSPHRQIALSKRLHALRQIHATDSKKQHLPFVPLEADAQRFIEAYEAHNSEVTAAVEPRRLLTFMAQQGWEPLCQFLGVDVPGVAYPKLHTLGRDQRHLKQQQHYLMVFDVFFFGIPLFGMAIMGHWLWKRYRSGTKIYEEKANV